MNNTHEISDDLLVKFLNDKASAKETELVLDYLSESDEHLEDFLTMCAALESHWDEGEIRETLILRRKRTRFLWWTSAAAAAIVIIIVGIFFFRSNGDENGPILAQQQPKEQQNGFCDTTIVTYDSIQQNDVRGDTAIRQFVPQQKSQKFYADSSRKYNYATMIYPTKAETSISNKRSVTLRWNSDAVNVHLKIVADDVTQLDENLGSVKMYQLQINPEIATYCWLLTFELPNKTTIEKRGKFINNDIVVD